MLGTDVVVAKRLRIDIGAIEHLIELARNLRLCIALLGIPRCFGLGTLLQFGDTDTGLLEQRHHDPVLLRKQRQQQMQIVHERIAGTAGQRHRFVDSVARLDGEAIRIQHGASSGNGEMRYICECSSQSATARPDAAAAPGR